MSERERNGHFLTTREAARVLDVHMNTLKRIPSEELPFFRVGRRGDRRYLGDDVLAYLERNRRG